MFESVAAMFAMSRHVIDEANAGRPVVPADQLQMYKEAMAEFQKVYVEKTVEVPLYYRKNVDLFGPKLGNFFANGTQAGPTWNAVDWFVAN